jgi:hypothetical protein
MTKQDDLMIALKANTAEVAAWFKALECVEDQDSPTATAIREHIEVLVDEGARIMGLPEDEIRRINAEAEAAIDDEIKAEQASVWQALESAPPEVLAEIKKFVARPRK